MTSGPTTSPRPGPPSPVAWLVHLFTACGVVLALLALIAVEAERWPLALGWLFTAFLVDGIDGSLARWARVKERAPRIDGDAMDLVIDYLTYVFVPALFIWRAGLVPETIAPWLTGTILISSLYVFVRRDMKTEDNYFRGFPALWNLVAFYLYVLQLRPLAGAIIVTLLVVATFAPVHFIHPFRVRDFGRWPQLLVMAWVMASLALLYPDWASPARATLLVISIATAVALVSLGLLRSLRGDRSSCA